MHGETLKFKNVKESFTHTSWKNIVNDVTGCRLETGWIPSRCRISLFGTIKPTMAVT